MILFGNLEHGSGVLVSAAVVRSRENGEQLAGGESLEPVHDALVRAQNVFHLIVI